MKKAVLITIICFLMSPIIIKADCSSEDSINHSKLASYVEYDFEYNESNKKFTVTFLNVQDDLNVVVGDIAYYTKNNKVVIKNVAPGTELFVTIIGSFSSACSSDILRIMNIKLPYRNSFFGSLECEPYENLSICSSAFLSYNLTKKSFDEFVESHKISESIASTTETPEEPVKILSLVWKFLEEQWIYITISLVLFGVLYYISNMILDRIKRGF